MHGHAVGELICWKAFYIQFPKGTIEIYSRGSGSASQHFSFIVYCVYMARWCDQWPGAFAAFLAWGMCLALPFVKYNTIHSDPATQQEIPDSIPGLLTLNTYKVWHAPDEPLHLHFINVPIQYSPMWIKCWWRQHNDNQGKLMTRRTMQGQTGSMQRQVRHCNDEEKASILIYFYDVLLVFSRVQGSFFVWWHNYCS